MKYNTEEKQAVYDDFLNSGSKSMTASAFGMHRSTVARIVKEVQAAIDEVAEIEVENDNGSGWKLKSDGSFSASGDIKIALEEVDTDAEIVDQNVKLAKKVFRLQDTQRLERKAFREHSRVDTMILELHEEMKNVLVENQFTDITISHDYLTTGGFPVGIVQLSDVHFNELVDDLESNSFNFEIASQRLHKLIRKAKPMFLANHVKEVCLALTGDLLNSDRRLDEITNAATNRSRAIFLAVDIIQQVIRDLNQDFNVTVASVTGNESRVGEHIHHSDFLAGDSYDIVIHNMLTYLFKGAEGVTFIPVRNPLECVVSIGENNILLVHGHLHRGLARNPETEVEKIKARYATRGVLISYVLCGHIHCAQISDLYSRSSGLPGANAFSERALNLVGRASQNIFIVNPGIRGEIDGIKVDLQNVDTEPMYEFDTTLASYQKKSPKATYTIQSVII